MIVPLCSTCSISEEYTFGWDLCICIRDTCCVFCLSLKNCCESIGRVFLSPVE